jgi:cytochrome bd-type quinol oxidase subunit 2
MKFSKIFHVLLVVVFLVLTLDAGAQCAMCKTSAESSEYAKSINAGVEYLLAAPIILVGAVIFLWIKNKEKFFGQES